MANNVASLIINVAVNAAQAVLTAGQVQAAVVGIQPAAAAAAAGLQNVGQAASGVQPAAAAAATGLQNVGQAASGVQPAAAAASASLSGLIDKAKGLAAAYASVQLAKEAISITAEFGDELQAVLAFSGASAEEMAKLRQNALDLAGAAGGPRAIAAGMADIASSGASAAEIMGVTGIVRDMAAASKGALDFATAGDVLTNTIKSYGMQITDAQSVADKLVKGWSSAGQSALDLGDGLKEISGIYVDLYRYLGNTAALEKSAAAIGVLAEVGFKGAPGATALKGALAQLVAPAGEGLKVLEKYKDVIKVFDDVGNVRDFSDILDDIGKAGLSAQEKINLFGREAMPAMTKLVNAGGQAIRDMEAKLKSADGTAAKVQTTMQDGLGGSFRQAGAEAEKAAIILTDNFTPALRAVLSLAGYADNAVQGLSGEIKTVAAIATVVGGVGMQIPRVWEGITDAIGITDSKTTVWADNSRAAFAAAKGLGNEASTSLKAAAGTVDEVAEAQKRLDSISAQVSSRFDEISAATGVTVNSMQELDAAVAAGKIKWDEATSSWIGAEKQKQEAVAKTALAATAAAEKAAEAEEYAAKEKFKKAEELFENYVDGIKKASGEIAAIGLLPTNTKKALDELDDLMAVAGQAGAAMTKAWADPADAVASYVPRLLGVADAEEAAVRQSLVALSAKDKALEAQHRQTLLHGKLIIEQVGVQAEVSKMEQETIWDIEDAYRGKLDAIMEVKSANGALIPGMQMVAGVWTNIGVAADRSNKQQLDGLQGLRLGMSSLAEELYELSLVGKNQEQVWKANQIAAAQYLQSAKELGAQAKREALKGNDEGAKQLLEAEAAAIAKADALYRKLAVTVKTEWSPAMEAAHKQSTESITKFGGAASKALDLARSGYDKVADAAKRSADAQQYFTDKQREIARESMTGAQAYEDIKKAAAEATAEAARLSKAGDWQGAQEQAKAAADAWAQVPKEVKEGEQTLVSSAESAKVRAEGIKQAGEISKAAYAAESKELAANAAAAQRNAEIIIAAEQAIVTATAAKLTALKAGNASAVAAADEEIAAAKARAEAAQKEVEAAAQKTGDSSGAQATQKEIDKINELVKANEAAAAAIKKQEEDKGKVISEESENAKIAAEGVVAAQQQLVDAYDEQRKTLENLAGVEVEIMKSVATATKDVSVEIKASVEAASKELDGLKGQIVDINAAVAAMPDKTITVTVKEVQARFGGGMINARNMSGGARVSGPTGYDSVHALLAGDEYIINNKSTADIGFGHFHFENTRQWDKALKSLASFHGPAETARLLSGFLPQPEITMRPLPSFRQQEPSQSADFMDKMKNFGTINLQIGDVAVPAMVQVDHLAIFQREQEKQRQRNRRATGRRP